MTKNMGSADRSIRTIAAVVIGILMLTGTISGIWGLILGIVAIAFLVTSAFAYCPLYLPFHVNTRGKGGSASVKA